MTAQYLALGHLAQDLGPEGRRLGGTVAYAALTALAWGKMPVIVTAGAADLDCRPLGAIPVARQPSPASTTFENIYTPQGRRQYVRAVADPIAFDSIPPAWRAAPVVHLGPLGQDFDPDWVGRFPGAFVGVTPQGWLRAWDANGLVSRADWPDGPRLLSAANAVVLSLEDLAGDWSLAEIWAKHTTTLVVTQGAQGCTVWARGQRQHFPAPAQAETDPTGAGDIFAATFFIHLQATGDIAQAARWANHTAAFSVTRPGLAGVPTPAEVAAWRAEA